MQPTTNTPFERFAFAVVIVLALLLPMLYIVLPLLLLFDSVQGLFNAGQGIGIKIEVGLMFHVVMLVIGFGIPIFCIISAIKIERDHIKALTKAEAEFSDIVVSDMKTLPPNWNVVNTVFISENVVIASDYFKAFFWMFRKLIGGESKSLSRLLSRARREATVRVLRKARVLGANVVWNIRYEASTIQSLYAKNSNQMVTGVEILAYATAFNVTAE
jgi:uncharacterized protein YbjQ (UPF0145 family)